MSEHSQFISIITPVYNAEKYLARTLESIISQSYSNWELILVNDGSTDDSSAIIARYAHNDLRIKVINQENAGPSVARNTGILKAEGTYLNFIDADDWVTTDYLEKLMYAMKDHIDLVCAGYFEINSNYPEGLQLHDFNQNQQNKIISKKEFQTNLFNGVTGVLWGKLFKKDIFDKKKIQLNSNLKLSEDLLAVLEYSKYIKNVYIIPDAIYYYNRANSGLSGKLKISNYFDIKTLIKELEKYTQELNFIDIKALANKRKYNFMVKLLNDSADSKSEFYEVADFLVKNEDHFYKDFLQDHLFNDKLLQFVFAGKYLQAWVIIKIYKFGRKIKNG